MAKHPEIQEKVAEEVDRVVGRDRPPSLEDRGKLVYSEAALYELLRFSSVAPLGVFHATMEDTTLGKVSSKILVFNHKDLNLHSKATVRSMT